MSFLGPSDLNAWLGPLAMRNVVNVVIVLVLLSLWQRVVAT